MIETKLDCVRGAIRQEILIEENFSSLLDRYRLLINGFFIRTSVFKRVYLYRMTLLQIHLILLWILCVEELMEFSCKRDASIA